MGAVIRIGICDDEPVFAEKLERELVELLTQREVEGELRRYSSGEALLAEAGELDAVFLDIEMPDMDGIAVGEQLRRRTNDCAIVMVTGVESRYKEAFHIRALSFVTKPVRREELSAALDEVLRERPGRELIELFVKNKPHWIAQRNIEYVRAYNGYTEFLVEGQRFRREESLNRIMEQLDPRLFVRIHRQYAVNLAKTRRAGEGVVRVGETELPVSRRLKAEFEKSYIEYDLNYR